MKPLRFEKFIARDRHCPHCGIGSPYLIPHHRKNRGMGGSKLLDRASNILSVCSGINGLMESDPEIANLARTYGWKLRTYESPLEVPIYDSYEGEWYRLGDDFERIKVTL